jgi:undecaprenyl pyrophosphate synthase
MLVACRLAGLSALGAHYAGVKLQECGPTLDIDTGNAVEMMGRDRCRPPQGNQGTVGRAQTRGVCATLTLRHIWPFAFPALISNGLHPPAAALRELDGLPGAMAYFLRVKTGEEAMADRSRSPAWIALSSSGRKVLTVIERQVWRGDGSISLALLGERADLCRSAVRHGVRLLVELGFVEVGVGFRSVSVFSLSARWRGVDADEAKRRVKRAGRAARQIAETAKDLRPEISTRAIGRAVGLPETTARRIGAAKAEKANKNSGGVRRVGALSGGKAAKLVWHASKEEEPTKAVRRSVRRVKAPVEQPPPPQRYTPSLPQLRWLERGGFDHRSA